MDEKYYKNIKEYHLPEQDKHKHRDVNYVAPENFDLLSDEDLILKPTKELNQLLKASNLREDQKMRLKLKRRTLKNRGYAAACRNKKEGRSQELDEMLENLAQQKLSLDEHLKDQQSEHDRKEQHLEFLRDIVNNKHNYQCVKIGNQYSIKVKPDIEIKEEQDDS